MDRLRVQKLQAFLIRVVLYGLLFSVPALSQSGKPNLPATSDGGPFRTAERSNVGVATIAGGPGEEDYDRAVSLYIKGSCAEAAATYRIACDRLSAKACTDLGVMYRKGQGVRKNYPRAAALLLQGCNGGNGLGCTDLGLMYWENVMPKDDKRAAELIQRGCEGGDNNGCRVIAFMFERGLGVPTDLNRAASFYQKAHEHRIPFEVRDGLILIDTTMNGSLVKLIVDTGGTTLLGAKFLPSTRPDLPITTLESVHGRSEVYRITVGWNLDGVIKNLHAVAGGGLAFPHETDGIFGADILEGFKSARFDFQNSLLILEDE